jgi:SAM-dependent methyltransferase
MNDSIYRDEGLAELYSRSRPTYPDALFQYLADLAPRTSHAIDCGTGNGQAARSLARYFNQVVAIDPSQEQLDNAKRAGNVRYYCGEAETIPADNRSVDLVTAAQAVHWFCPDRFDQEVQRVLRPGGVLAVWCYLLPSVNEAVDQALQKLYHDQRLYKYWPAWIRHIECGYFTLPCIPGEHWCPFSLPTCDDRDLQSFLNVIDTWVATRLSRKAGDPIAEACLDEGRKEIGDKWGAAGTLRTVSWRICGGTVIPRSGQD